MAAAQRELMTGRSCMSDILVEIIQCGIRFNDVAFATNIIHLYLRGQHCQQDYVKPGYKYELAQSKDNRLRYGDSIFIHAFASWLHLNKGKYITTK